MVFSLITITRTGPHGLPCVRLCVGNRLSNGNFENSRNSARKIPASALSKPIAKSEVTPDSPNSEFQDFSGVPPICTFAAMNSPISYFFWEPSRISAGVLETPCEVCRSDLVKCVGGF